MKAQDFIKKKPYLVWHTKNYRTLSNAAVVEAVLNYGDFDDVKGLIKTLGIKTVSAIFRKQIKGSRCNYDPMIKSYFSLYFKNMHKEILTDEQIAILPVLKSFSKQ